MNKPPSDLIFEALCLRYRSTTNVSEIMTRQELQEATGSLSRSWSMPCASSSAQSTRISRSTS